MTLEGVLFFFGLAFVVLFVGPALGAGAYRFARFVAVRFVEPKYASLLACLVSAILCIAMIVTVLGAGVAGFLLWKDMAKLKPKGEI